MWVRWKLRHLMDRHRITVKELSEKSGVGRDAIIAARNNTSNEMNRDNIGALCETLDSTLDDLFDLIPEDIWGPIRLSREVTIHIGSRANLFTDVGDGSYPVQQVVGLWDLRAARLIREFLRKCSPDIEVCEEEHTQYESGLDPEAQGAAGRVLRQGNHILIGSPLANQFAEKVISQAYNVAPCSPSMRNHFPYGFVWPAGRSVLSSFGWQAIGNEFGIASTLTGELVASRTIETDGEGDDCALILVLRLWQPPARRSPGGEEERTIIAILGHSGVGTYAATQLATDPKLANQLFPPHRDVPLMRVVRSRYNCRPVTPPRDNRQVIARSLVEEVDTAPGAIPSSPDVRRPRPPA